ncbi:MAG: hypothetical protein NTW46_01005 [Candidatus Nealsonbacteria bacterium]|nr:hypothetical protein [Candidatus Nealsonbacteria bacterium]
MDDVSNLLSVLFSTPIGFGLIIYLAVLSSITLKRLVEGEIGPEEKEGRKFLIKLASALLAIGLLLLIGQKIFFLLLS